MALTVLELEEGEFHWVIMEAVDSAGDDVISYTPLDSSEQGYGSYVQALAHGAAAMGQRRVRAAARAQGPATSADARPRGYAGTPTH